MFLWHIQEKNSTEKEFINIRDINEHGKIYGITRYTFNSKYILTCASVAKSAILKNNNTWQLNDVRTHCLFPNKKSKLKHNDHEEWKITLNNKLINTLSTDPISLSLIKLLDCIQYLKKQAINNKYYELIFWSKVLQPLITISLVLMAISFVFGPLRTLTIGNRIFIGVLIGVICRIIQEILGPLSLVLNFSPLILLILQALCFFCIGIWQLSQTW